jgi:hypothetical protein
VSIVSGALAQARVHALRVNLEHTKLVNNSGTLVASRVKHVVPEKPVSDATRLPLVLVFHVKKARLNLRPGNGTPSALPVTRVMLERCVLDARLRLRVCVDLARREPSRILSVNILPNALLAEFASLASRELGVVAARRESALHVLKEPLSVLLKVDVRNANHAQLALSSPRVEVIRRVSV